MILYEKSYDESSSLNLETLNKGVLVVMYDL